MSHRRRKLPSALKHGIYSATDILPGESRAEFEKWHREIVAELHPTGALEEQAVYDVARFSWRKRNMLTLRLAERAQQRNATIRDERIFGEPEPDTALQDELGPYAELVEVGRCATFKGLTQDLKVEDLLDSKIDRALKRLLHLKGIKSLTNPQPVKQVAEIEMPSRNVTSHETVPTIRAPVRARVYQLED
jgi:hypothetical protein